MEFKECAYDNEKSKLNDEPNCPQCSKNIKILLSFSDHNVLLKQHRNFEGQAENQSENDIEQEKHEIFSIVVAHTIRNPWTMMVHIENASLAGRAMMASKCYEIVTFQA